MQDEQKGVLIGLIAGLLAGFASVKAGGILGVAAGIIIAFALASLHKAVFKEKKRGWLAGNIMVPYIFTWLIAWIFLVNV